MPASFTRAFAERLNRIVALKVLEAEHGVELQPGAVYIAPGGKNLELVVGKDGALRLEVGLARANESYLPSIDRLFGSVAQQYAGPILAAILTGMGSDGAEGVRKIAAAGGKILAESEGSAVVFGMPQAAIDTGCVDEILSLVELIDRILQYSTKQEPPEG
jgi:two-component system chemotaxis response regulator CheB